MINGYVTYNELKLITGYSDPMLNQLLIQGISQHQLEIQVDSDKRFSRPLRECLFNLSEVENWIKLHIF